MPFTPLMGASIDSRVTIPCPLNRMRIQGLVPADDTNRCLLCNENGVETGFITGTLVQRSVRFTLNQEMTGEFRIYFQREGISYFVTTDINGTATHVESSFNPRLDQVFSYQVIQHRRPVQPLECPDCGSPGTSNIEFQSPSAGIASVVLTFSCGNVLAVELASRRDRTRQVMEAEAIRMIYGKRLNFYLGIIADLCPQSNGLLTDYHRLLNELDNVDPELEAAVNGLTVVRERMRELDNGR